MKIPINSLGNDMKEPGSSIKALLDCIPADARTVIEVSANSDARLEAAFKRRNPVCRYLNVQIVESPSELVSQDEDHIVIADLGEFDPAAYGVDLDTVDCLICYDVMHTSSDAAAYINIISQWLPDQCVVLVSAQNPQYWQHIKALIQGGQKNIPPRQGITIPQFTAEEIRECFLAQGFHVFDIRGTRGDIPGHKHFMQAVQPLLRVCNVNGQLFSRQSRSPQLIIRAVRVKPPNDILIQSMTLKPVAACNDVRIHGPETFLATVPGVITRTSVGSDARLIKRGGDKVFIWQRPILNKQHHLTMLRRLINSGYMIVVDFDDDPDHWPAIARNDYLTFAGVHAVQTSTEVLASLLRKYNPNVKVFPNQIIELPPVKQPPENDKVKIFFGALNRTDDWKKIINSLNNILDEYGEKLHVTVVHDRGFFEALKTRYKEFYETCDYESYQQHLRKCDIGLLPLESNRFNNYKSDLKFIEHAACGVVAIAGTTVYSNSIRDSETGMLFSSEEEFSAKLKSLVERPDLRNDIVSRAYEWVAHNRLLSQHYRERLDWYFMMCSRLDQLNQELLERFPELSDYNQT